MKAERFVYEFANYRKKQLKELVKTCPALGCESYKKAIQGSIANIEKYVKARENGYITPTEALECIAKC